MSTALEPTFSARETAAILGRSYSWIDQLVRHGEFTLPNGTVLQRSRTAGGYRRFSTELVKELAFCCYRQGWFKMDSLRSGLLRLAVAV
jgi:hypothetical protein